MFSDLQDSYDSFTVTLVSSSSCLHCQAAASQTLGAGVQWRPGARCLSGSLRLVNHSFTSRLIPEDNQLWHKCKATIVDTVGLLFCTEPNLASAS